MHIQFGSSTLNRLDIYERQTSKLLPLIKMDINTSIYLYLYLYVEVFIDGDRKINILLIRFYCLREEW